MPARIDPWGRNEVCGGSRTRARCCRSRSHRRWPSARGGEPRTIRLGDRSRRDASPIPGDQRAAQWTGDEPLPATDIQRLRATPHHDGDDVDVTADAAVVLDRHTAAPVQVDYAGVLAQFGNIDGQANLRPHAALDR